MEVFVLHHVHELEGGAEDAKLVGVYSSSRNAEAAIRRLSARPGFCDAPEGFEISRYTLDEDHWREGFVVLKPEAEQDPP